MTHTDFKTVPMGLFLMRTYHASTGGPVLHFCLKVRDADFYEQAACPVYSETMMKPKFEEFWAWALENLPIYEYPDIVKAAIA